jgi:hypothetical protein
MTTTLAAEIDAFAAAVRAELSDLGPDELDDLTDGLEADLTERVADAPEEDLGDAAAYAADLRAAAGYPPRSASAHVGSPGALPSLRSASRILRDRWVALVARRPLIAGTLEMLVALRPVWWVLRGALVAMLVLPAFVSGSYGVPWNGAVWLVTIVAIVLSVQIGRGRWLGSLRSKAVIKVVNPILVIIAPLVFATAIGAVNSMYNAWYFQEEMVTTIYPDGLSYNGANVGNIYAYDAEGNPIDQVQLFDQFGEPLVLAGDPTQPWTVGPHDTAVVPSGDVPGGSGWNVYPLRELNGVPSDPAVDFDDASVPLFPFVVVRPLAVEPSSTSTNPAPEAPAE